eukprot:3356487-Rhodomonas_salina.1
MREQELAGIVKVTAQYAEFAENIQKASDQWAAAQRVYSPLLTMAPEDVCTQWQAIVAQSTDVDDSDDDSYSPCYFCPCDFHCSVLVGSTFEQAEEIVYCASREIEYRKKQYEEGADHHQRRTAPSRPYPQRQMYDMVASVFPSSLAQCFDSNAGIITLRSEKELANVIKAAVEQEQLHFNLPSNFMWQRFNALADIAVNEEDIREQARDEWATFGASIAWPERRGHRYRPYSLARDLHCRAEKERKESRAGECAGE